jgi:hypothetical protein
MGIEGEKRIVYNHETLLLKSTLQKGVIEFFCGEDTHNGEYNAKVSKWIEEYSKKFREIFERRLIEEIDFVERCTDSVGTVAIEIAKEIKG